MSIEPGELSLQTSDCRVLCHSFGGGDATALVTSLARRAGGICSDNFLHRLYVVHLEYALFDGANVFGGTRGLWNGRVTVH
jgi:hypothetical protein